MVRLTREPINANELVALVGRDDCGAVAVFLGTVRSVTGDHETQALEYEAYREMAERTMSLIEADARANWPIREAALAHRLGRLAVGEVSVGVAVSSPHRADAFESCRYLIDRLKAEVPIWKRDIAASGTATWVHPDVTS
jgi:molybdopterin synthase catalytic subunit